MSGVWCFLSDSPSGRLVNLYLSYFDIAEGKL